MCKPSAHYGVDIDRYEYDLWGTHHFADRYGIGVDCTVETGSGYTAQDHDEIRMLYNNVETCPDDDLLFFHHVNYTHRLHSGKTVIQHIYDEHFEGVRRGVPGGLGEAAREGGGARLRECADAAQGTAGVRTKVEGHRQHVLLATLGNR
jgi:hypothetical protein